MARATDPIRAKQAATHIVRTLQGAGYVAYFAGGCVRDGLLGLHPTDYDVATDAPPQRVRALFPRTAEVGAAFGVVLVHVTPDDAGNRASAQQLVSVEVATFRSDGPYSDARRPDTVRFSDPRSDAQRRDFTINALFLDPLAPADDSGATLAPGDLQGRIIDFVGGVEDLKRRIVRAVGDPDRRLAEDHLRALRAVRFAARLGFTLDVTTGEAITRHAAALRGVSRERIGEELRRMLAHPARAAALGMLQRLTLDAPVLNEAPLNAPLAITAGLPANAGTTTALAAWAVDRETARRGIGTAWLSDVTGDEVARRWRGALMLSNDETQDLEDELSDSWAITQRWIGMRVSQRKRLAARPVFGKSLQIVRAWNRAVADGVEKDIARLAGDGVGINPEPLVTGDDLVTAGMKPGPRFKGVLDEVRDAQLEGRLKNKQEGMELARRLSVQ
jgi:tRNA nucleotidyltransferase/poly(A) polymerase